VDTQDREREPIGSPAKVPCVASAELVPELFLMFRVWIADTLTTQLWLPHKGHAKSVGFDCDAATLDRRLPLDLGSMLMLISHRKIAKSSSRP
jgi:hypothetical protein